MPADTTIIIVTYNSAHIIRRTLDNLPEGYPTIIIDNASQDDTCEKIQSHPRPHVTLIRHNENSGYGTGNNIGMKKCKTRYALILNPDAEITASTIKTLKTALQSHKDSVIASPSAGVSETGEQEKIIKLPPYPLFHKSHPLFPPSLLNPTWWRRNILKQKPYKIIRDFSKIYECGVANGAVFLYDLQKMPTPVYFDEDIFMCHEDTELPVRIMERGYKLLLVPEAKAKHRGGDSTQFESSAEKIRFYYYQSAYSRGVLAAKYPDRINKRDMHALMRRYWLFEKLTRLFGMHHKKIKYSARLQGLKDGLKHFAK